MLSEILKSEIQTVREKIYKAQQLLKVNSVKSAKCSSSPEIL